MKLLLIILSYLIMTEAYKDVDDNHLQTLMQNKEAFRMYVGCLVDKNPCDDFGQRAKDHAVEALSDSCKECDDIQKHVSHSIIKAMKTEFPELYEAFEDKYDPDRTLLAKLDEKVKEYWK